MNTSRLHCVQNVLMQIWEPSQPFQNDSPLPASCSLMHVCTQPTQPCVVHIAKAAQVAVLPAARFPQTIGPSNELLAEFDRWGLSGPTNGALDWVELSGASGHGYELRHGEPWLFCESLPRRRAERSVGCHMDKLGWPAEEEQRGVLLPVAHAALQLGSRLKHTPNPLWNASQMQGTSYRRRLAHTVTTLLVVMPRSDCRQRQPAEMAS